MNKTGLTSAEVEESRRKNGSNMLTQIPPDPLWKKILEGFTDPMIIILLVALVIELILWLCGKADWYEPVGIFVAIIIANGVASVSESKQEGRASAPQAEEAAQEGYIKPEDIARLIAFRNNPSDESWIGGKA